jgi:hypothetical protein
LNPPTTQTQTDSKMTKKIIISTLVSTLILFFWSGMTQMLPWGISSTQNINVQTMDNQKQAEVTNLQRLDKTLLVTEKFETQFNNKVSTLSTDKTFSWIVTQPIKSNYSSYFITEVFTQLFVAFFIALLLVLTIKLDNRSRIIIISIAGICATISTYGQLMNWWGLPASYGIGVSINLLIGWTIVAFISAKFIIKNKTI